MRRTCEDSVRGRLREIEAELAELAVGASMPSEREAAQALLLEAQRIKRNANRDAAGDHPGR
jgi:hypothetical protein